MNARASALPAANSNTMCLQCVQLLLLPEQSPPPPQLLQLLLLVLAALPNCLYTTLSIAHTGLLGVRPCQGSRVLNWCTDQFTAMRSYVRPTA